MKKQMKKLMVIVSAALMATALTPMSTVVHVNCPLYKPFGLSTSCMPSARLPCSLFPPELIFPPGLSSPTLVRR